MNKTINNFRVYELDSRGFRQIGCFDKEAAACGYAYARATSAWTNRNRYIVISGDGRLVADYQAKGLARETAGAALDLKRHPVEDDYEALAQAA